MVFSAAVDWSVQLNSEYSAVNQPPSAIIRFPHLSRTACWS